MYLYITKFYNLYNLLFTTATVTYNATTDKCLPVLYRIIRIYAASIKNLIKYYLLRLK